MTRPAEMLPHARRTDNRGDFNPHCAIPESLPEHGRIEVGEVFFSKPQVNDVRLGFFDRGAQFIEVLRLGRAEVAGEGINVWNPEPLGDHGGKIF